MNKVFSRKRYKNAILALCAIVSLQVSTNPAQAVTNPVGTLKGTDASWSVSLWSDKNEDGLLEFSCSGSLIGAQWVLTAAHCIKDIESDIYVQHGVESLYEETDLYYVDSLRFHQRYSESSLQNDIGLLHLENSVPGPYLKLPGTNDSSLLSSKRGMWLVAWGEDQNGETNGTLGITQQFNQSLSASRYFEGFNTKTMIAAGAYNKNERLWSGSCYGDSGGPLSALPQRTLLGIVSFGAETCSTDAPSVYTRVSYYLPWIASAKTAILGDIARVSSKPPATAPTSQPLLPPNLTEMTGLLGAIELKFIPSPSAARHAISCVDEKGTSSGFDITGSATSITIQVPPLRTYNCAVVAFKGSDNSMSNVRTVYVPISYFMTDPVGDSLSNVDVNNAIVGFYENEAIFIIGGPTNPDAAIIYGLDGSSRNRSFFLTVWRTPGKSELSIIQDGVTTRLDSCRDIVLKAGNPGEWNLIVPKSCFRFPSTASVSISVLEAARATTVNDQVTFTDRGIDIIRTYP